jgi:hypothetical protein
VGLPRLNLPSVSERLGNVTDRLRGLVPQGLSGRIGLPHGLSAAGGLTLPYKLAVVAVMMLVAGGTLVTFGSAGAETAAVGSPTATSASAALPGTSEVAPRVEGQVMPGNSYDYTPDTSILSADDLLASLKLTDYSPKSDDNNSDDDNKKNDDNNNKKNDNKSSSTPTATPTQSASGGSTGNSGSSGGSTTNNGGSSSGGQTDPPKTDPPKTDPPKTDPPKEDPPKEDEKPIQCKLISKIDPNCH